MAEARRPGTALSSVPSGTVSGESDSGATRKKPKTRGEENQTSSVDLTVALEGLVVSLPPDSRPVSLSLRKTRRRGLEAVGRTSSHSPRSHRKGRLVAKNLFEAKKVQAPEWTQEEHKQLVEFMLLYTDGKSWVQNKDMRFWGAAGEFIQKCLKTMHCRSGTQ